MRSTASRSTPRTPNSPPHSRIRLNTAPLANHVALAIDATGVGAPVIDHFRQQLPAIPLYAITITAGASITGGHKNPHVPKRDLISTTSVILEQRRLRIAANMRDTETITDELLAYRRTTTDHGNETYAAAAGNHDDLVLALSLALWTAEHKPLPHPHHYTRQAQRRIPTFTDIALARSRNLKYW